MKTLSILILIVYWSIIILAPVLAKNQNNIIDQVIYPEKKPSK